MVDGEDFAATVYLAAALRHVRNHWCAAFPGRNPDDFWLWADAICVNQTDVDEHNSKVQASPQAN
jgi:hypothetical protein